MTDEFTCVHCGSDLAAQPAAGEGLREVRDRIRNLPFTSDMRPVDFRRAVMDVLYEGEPSVQHTTILQPASEGERT